ncbi:MAG: hypothetical protein KatS3mg044_0786 [Rhodothermaceae bacterium]|nr:MAG: hypothetical protein D6746_12540 [Bacteroidota bacterium]GIV61920.1 MAG: hypothetical protein KatS3mg044_0786 [Rhodothermaceae bacterium]
MKHLISRKKDVYPISDFFREYLIQYGRVSTAGIRYEDLKRFDNEIPVYNEVGEDTLWSTVFYPPGEQEEIHHHLLLSYAILKAEGDISFARNLFIDRVDVCNYGNTLPFRVRVVNRLNENFDYFYIKRVDANRIYGLELEHILSPNRINYFIYGNTVIEEHVIGIPAHDFVRESMPMTRFDLVRLAKEFVKFNERSFICLLGDMHSGNFVIDITRDFEKWHFHMRPIDFDQQSHHWRKETYIPECYPQNAPFLRATRRYLKPENVEQYQQEEHALIAGRVRVSHGRFDRLMEVMREDLIAPDEHVRKLGAQLAAHYEDPAFERGLTMGDLVYTSLRRIFERKRTPNPLLQPTWP